MGAIRGVGVFLKAKCVDRHGGGGAVGGPAQHAGAGAAVDVEFLVVGACVPVDEVV